MEYQVNHKTQPFWVMVGHLVPNVQTLAGHVVGTIHLAPTTTLHFATVLKTKNGWVLWFTWYSVCTIFKNSSFKTALWNLVANLVKIRILLQTLFQPSVAKLPIVKLKKKDALKLLKSVFSWMSDEINSLCLSSIYSMYKQLWIFWHSHAFWRRLRISSKKTSRNRLYKDLWLQMDGIAMKCWFC